MPCMGHNLLRQRKVPIPDRFIETRPDWIHVLSVPEVMPGDINDNEFVLDLHVVNHVVPP